MSLRLLFCLLASSLSFGQTIDETVVPRKSEIFIRLQRSLNTKTAQTGDKFSSVVEVPVTVDDHIVIPVGSYIIGYVDKSKKPGRLRGKAEMTLRFDTVILPSGVTRYMRAAVQSADGYESAPQNEDGEIRGSGGQAGETISAAVRGAITGAIIGTATGAYRGSAGRGAGIGTALGAAGAGLMALLKKGQEVALPKGTSLTIQLQDDLRFEKPTSHRSGKRLEGSDDPS